MSATPIFDAVTVALICDDEIFMIRRHEKLLSFPGYWAFPGGKVDKQDRLVAQRDAKWCRGHAPHLIEALVRELREELDFDVDAAAESGELLGLSPIGHALTPDIAPVRFDTHFFKLRLRARPAFRLDSNEAAAGDWASAAHWMSRYRDGRLLLAPPTQGTLHLFETGGDTDSGTSVLENIDRGCIPMVESLNGIRQFFVRSNTLPPARHTNAFLLGDMDAHRVLVDPSPESAEELEKLIRGAQTYGFHEVFLTHHHPDHREYADELARRLGVPIGMSQDTQERIRAESGERFFSGLQVKTYGDGDAVTRWLGRTVHVVAVPGHDEGQLALMPEDRAWCIVGDLIQGVGTVVISKPEGHMGRYFRSLQRVIALDPAVIFPSHGLGMGSSFRLRETLKHRELREEQVRSLHASGLSIDQILAEIYRDTDPRLMPLAKRNIEAHLDKLREDGAIA
jgi:glyoxylase-like metal-dependent hydrolase (beta-lactamase superfamily II)/8-oxo-dGTP pyrophosphatase MutT (NUDIX family)